MSGFDSNPFADPEAGLLAGKNVPAGKTTEDLIEDFNPFAVDQFSNQQVPPSQPAIMQPSTSEQPPPYSSADATPSAVAATRGVTDDLQRRQEELDRKAAEIDRREKELNSRHVLTSARVNNFPPLPSWFPLKPCFYQDFTLDIPSEFQKLVKAHFYYWIAYCLLLFVNIGGALGSLVTKSTNECGTTFGLSILYFVLFTPCSFVCWYRPAYNAFRADSSFYFFLYFFVFFIQFCAHVIQAIGIDGSGSCGFINGIQSINTNIAVGIIMLMIGALFTGCAVTSMVLLIKVHRIYRSSGASFSKAQQEFSQGVWRNRAVQETTANIASSAAQQAFTDVRH